MNADRKIATGQSSIAERIVGMPALGRDDGAESRLDALCSALPNLPRTQRAGLLDRAIERAVIPRLLLFAAAAAPPGGPGRSVPVEEVSALAHALLEDAMPEARHRLAMLAEDGHGFSRLCLEVLAPCARLLGRMWEEDLCDFVAVTLGLIRLQRLLREITPPPGSGLPLRDARHRILLGAAPGEQHGFGLQLVAEFFRQDGWQVRAEACAPPRELAGIVAQEWFAVAGFSASCEDRLAPLAAAIVAVRRASRNAGIGILVGGPVFLGHPELATRVGADAMAVDGVQAVAQAHRFIGLLALPA